MISDSESDDEEYGVQRDYKDINNIKKTPFSLGVELLCGKMSVIIPRNTIIPYQETKKYITTQDNQVSITCKVYQGERLLAKENEKLGECILDTIPPKTRGKVSIYATLEVREDNFFNIILKENVNGTQSALINQINMHEDKDKNFFEKIYKEAKMHEKEDKKIIEINCKTNDLKYYCNRLKNHGNEEQKNKANQILEWTKTYLNEDIKEYDKKLNEIKNLVIKND